MNAKSRSAAAKGPSPDADLAARTIDDFGDQWLRYTDNEGYYGDIEMLADILGPLLPISALQGARVAEIGSGTGRIVQMLLRAGVAHVTAIEPSAAFAVLRERLAGENRVTLVHGVGTEISRERNLDFVLSIGVIHHIPEPDPVLRAAYQALRPGGSLVIWVYGSEGGGSVLRLIKALRRVTTHLPHWILAPISHVLTFFLDLYIVACRAGLRLPLRDYVLNVVGRFPRSKRYLVVYDQLKPAFSKYYAADEVRALIQRAGFSDVQLHLRHGYSWTAIGTKPPAASG